MGEEHPIKVYFKLEHFVTDDHLRHIQSGHAVNANLPRSASNKSINAKKMYYGFYRETAPITVEMQRNQNPVYGQVGLQELALRFWCITTNISSRKR